MYEKGMLEVWKITPCPADCVDKDQPPHAHYTSEYPDGQRYSAMDGYPPAPGVDTTPYARLPHSCDEWVIGGVDEIDALVADLLVAREQLLKED